MSVLNFIIHLWLHSNFICTGLCLYSYLEMHSVMKLADLTKFIKLSEYIVFTDLTILMKIFLIIHGQICQSKTVWRNWQFSTSNFLSVIIKIISPVKVPKNIGRIHMYSIVNKTLSSLLFSLLHVFLDTLYLISLTYSIYASKILNLLLTLQCVVLELRHLSLHILV